MLAAIRHFLASKEAHHGIPSPPPRPTIDLPQSATVVPLDQLWTRLPPKRRQEALIQLTRILAQRLTPSNRKEGTDE